MGFLLLFFSLSLPVSLLLQLIQPIGLVFIGESDQILWLESGILNCYLL